MFKVLCLLVIVTVVAGEIYCRPHFCDRVKCGEVNCGPNERLKENGSSNCGCCSACITQIQKGENCAFLLAPGTQFRQKECEKGTTCQGSFDKATCQ